MISQISLSHVRHRMPKWTISEIIVLFTLNKSELCRSCKKCCPTAKLSKLESESENLTDHPETLLGGEQNIESKYSQTCLEMFCVDLYTIQSLMIIFQSDHISAITSDQSDQIFVTKVKLKCDSVVYFIQTFRLYLSH